MNRLGALMIFGGALSLLIAVPAVAQSEREGSVVAFPADGIGKTCEIVLKSKAPGSVVINAGKMARLDDEFVVLRNATRTVQVNKTVPILGEIPILGVLFHFTAVRTEKVPGELKVPRTEVASVQIAE